VWICQPPCRRPAARGMQRRAAQDFIWGSSKSSHHGATSGGMSPEFTELGNAQLNADQGVSKTRPTSALAALCLLAPLATVVPAATAQAAPSLEGLQCLGEDNGVPSDFVPETPATSPDPCSHNSYDEPLITTQALLGQSGVPVERLRGYRWTGTDFVQIPGRRASWGHVHGWPSDRGTARRSHLSSMGRVRLRLRSRTMRGSGGESSRSLPSSPRGIPDDVLGLRIREPGHEPLLRQVRICTGGDLSVVRRDGRSGQCLLRPVRHCGRRSRGALGCPPGGVGDRHTSGA